MNVIEVLYNLFFRLLEWSSLAWDFIFTTHKIGITLIKNPFGDNYLIDLSFSLNLFNMLIGGGFLVFLILYLVKEFVPMA